MADPATAISNGLVVDRVTVRRAGVGVVRDASLTAEPGEVTVVLGANGAGKTSLLESISGLIRLSSGHVLFNDVELSSKPRSVRARLGLAHVQQGRAVFPELTVKENLLVAAPSESLSRAYEVFPDLERLASAQAGLLSGGEQQMLVIARALIVQPRLLMIDEMSLGLAPTIVRRLFDVVAECAASGMAVLLVEQFRSLALAYGSQAYVMARGRIEYSGPAEALKDSPDLLVDLYLGRKSQVP